MTVLYESALTTKHQEQMQKARSLLFQCKFPEAQKEIEELEKVDASEDAGFQALVALLKAKYHSYQGDYIKAEKVLKTNLTLLEDKIEKEEGEKECPLNYLRHKSLYSLIKICLRMRQYTQLEEYVDQIKNLKPEQETQAIREKFLIKAYYYKARALAKAMEFDRAKNLLESAKNMIVQFQK